MNMKLFFRSEPAFLFCLLTAIIFLSTGSHWLDFEKNMTLYIVSTVWLLLTTLIAAFLVVRHSDSLAVKMGEPFGTLVLTLSGVIYRLPDR